MFYELLPSSDYHRVPGCARAETVAGRRPDQPAATGHPGKRNRCPRPRPGEGRGVIMGPRAWLSPREETRQTCRSGKQGPKANPSGRKEP